jgi:cytochrome P450
MSFCVEYSIMDLFAAGSETTSTTLRWALLFLVLNPKVQVSRPEAIHLVRMLDLRYS